MGEVYEASDTTLGRTVALKILPLALVTDPERVRRFVQEAKTASSLNHPNIVTIYEVGEFGSVRFIAMELIDGETIAAKMLRRTNLRSLLGWLAEAAEGVAKAHSAGIIHRDLKPDNIMVTREGHVKVLDFGVAKLIERRETSPEDTTMSPQTARGVILGTPAYMSPEQVRGEEVDHRSDIFSFGCILYEAATGTRAFQSHSDIDVMHAIVHEEPEPVERLNANVPAALRRLIRRCMRKEPDQRFQSMRDLAVAIHEVYEDFEQLTVTSEEATAQRTPSSPAAAIPSRFRRTAVAAVIAICTLGGAVIAWRYYAPPRARGQVTLDRMRIERLTSAGSVYVLAISPDGKYLAYDSEIEGGKYALSLRQIVTGSEVRIVESSSPLNGATFSTDSNYIYYVAGDNGMIGYSSLYRVPTLGGDPHKLLFDIDTAPSISPHGQITFIRGIPIRHEYAVMVADADGSNLRPLTVRRTYDPNRVFSLPPAWLKEGTEVAFIVLSREAGGRDQISAIDIATHQERIVSRRWKRISSVARLRGAGVVVTASDEGQSTQQLWIVNEEGSDAIRLTSGSDEYFGATATDDGKRIAAIQLRIASRLYAGTSVEPLTPVDLEVLDIDAADSHVVFAAKRNGKTDLWLLDPTTRSLRQLTDDGTARRPSLSRDGNILLFTSGRTEGVSHVWHINREGGNARQLTRGGGEFLPSVSPDGLWFTYLSADGSLWRQEFGGGFPKKLATAIVLGEGMRGPVISSDGKRILVSQWVSEGSALPKMSWRTILSHDGAVAATLEPRAVRGRQWMPDGNRIAGILDGAGSNIWSFAVSGGAPQQLTHFASGFIAAFDWSDDGQTLFVARGTRETDAVMISDFR